MSVDRENLEHGNVILRPVMAWFTAPVADIAVLLAVEYSEKPQNIESGGKLIQLVLMPQQCLDLAETLTRQAKRVLEGPPPTEKRN